MSTLFSPFTIKKITLKNRIVISPMCQYSANDGFADTWHLVHLGSRAVGGAGLVMAEATAISPEGRITPDDLGIWKDGHIGKLKEITTFIKAQGSVAGIQLAHAGRKASISSEWKGNGKFLQPDEGGWPILAPSALPFSDKTGTPAEMTGTDIRKVTADFASAVRRAIEAGFQVIEIHAAHGYLLHEFLSPLTNHRDDEYGGNFVNRTRLIEEVIDAVKQVIPPYMPLFVRISATDWVEDGWNLEQSTRLARILINKGIDILDVSSGGLMPHTKIPAGYGYQLPFASHIKKETGISTGTVGMITNAVQAETILRNQEADLIFIGRESLRDPYFPLHAAKQLGDDTEWPVQYQRAK